MSTKSKTQPATGAGSRRGVRRGELMWWLFHSAATPLPVLAEAALETGFPTLYLPLPVSRTVAFQRALQRATASVPQELGRWQANRLTDIPQILEQTAQRLFERFVASPAGKEWSARLPTDAAGDAEATRGLFVERSEFGILLEWDRQGETTARPWIVHLWCALPPAGEVVLVPTDEGAGASESAAMAERVVDRFRQEMTHANAPEIGDAVMAALSDASGVRIRPGLWTVPRETGVRLVTSATAYLRSAGDAQAGRFHLIDRREEAEEIAKATGLSLRIQAHDLVEAVGLAVSDGGTGALRSRWAEVAELENRLEAHLPLAAGVEAEVRALLDEARKRLVAEARNRDKELGRTASQPSKEAFRDALQWLSAAPRIATPAPSGRRTSCCARRRERRLPPVSALCSGA